MAYCRKNIETKKRFQVNIAENYVNVLTLGFEHMRKSCIYTGIPGLLDILGQ